MMSDPPPETTHTPPGTPGSGAPGPQLRPPDSMLPKSERHAERSGGAKAGLYVSSGGQTYGPSTPREVVASVRTGYFNEDAVFWVESRNEWRPLTELAQHVELPPPSVEPAHLELPPRIPLHAPPTQAVTPKWPGAGRRSSTSSASSSSSPRGERRRRDRKGRPGKPPKGRLAGRLIVFGAILLAILITAGVLLLISAV